MSILHSRTSAPAEPHWLPAPREPALPPTQVHLWRVRLAPAGGACPIAREQAAAAVTALFRRDLLERYGPPPGLAPSPFASLRIAIARCDSLLLAAVSRAGREIGLDTERVRDDIPFDEMATGFLDPASQWDIRITRSRHEKAMKFFGHWTTSEACEQARAAGCRVRGFIPLPGYVAALATGGPAAELSHWEWAGPRESTLP